MQSKKNDNIVKVAKELRESYAESAKLLTDFNGTINDAYQFYDHGYGGAGKSMVSLGIAIVMIPEPFMVSDVIGSGIIATGLLYNKLVAPPLYIDNIFETIQEEVKAIHDTGESINQNYSVPIDFSSAHFEI